MPLTQRQVGRWGGCVRDASVAGTGEFCVSILQIETLSSVRSGRRLQTMQTFMLFIGICTGWVVGGGGGWCWERNCIQRCVCVHNRDVCERVSIIRRDEASYASLSRGIVYRFQIIMCGICSRVLRILDIAWFLGCYVCDFPPTIIMIWHPSTVASRRENWFKLQSVQAIDAVLLFLLMKAFLCIIFLAFLLMYRELGVFTGLFRINLQEKINYVYQYYTSNDV